jgi:hypothetical protein
LRNDLPDDKRMTLVRNDLEFHGFSTTSGGFDRGRRRLTRKERVKLGEIHHPRCRFASPHEISETCDTNCARDESGLHDGEA